MSTTEILGGGRYLLARGELFLDLDTGRYFELNTTAARIVRALLAGRSHEDAAAEHGAAYDLEPSAAIADVRAVAAVLAEDDQPAAGPLVFLADPREPEVLRMSSEGELVARLAADGAWIEPVDGRDLRARLQWAAPHLLALRGVPVLHASAILTRPSGVVHAFSGASGAGKTTLARTSVRAGAALVAEDLLVLSADRADGVCVALDGEKAVRAWVERAAEGFEGGARRLDARALDEAAHGPSASFVELLYLDAGARRGDALLVEPVRELDAMRLLLQNAFAEIASRAVWREVFATSERLAASVAIGSVALPLGLEPLARAVFAWARAGFVPWLDLRPRSDDDSRP